MTTPEVLKDKAPEPAREFSPEMMSQFRKWTAMLVSTLSRKEQRVERTDVPTKNPAEAERYAVAEDKIERRLEAAKEIQLALG
jgi:hypothetical protein